MKNLKEQIYWQVHDTVKPIARRDYCTFHPNHSNVRDKISMGLLIRVLGQVQKRIGDLRF